MAACVEVRERSSANQRDLALVARVIAKDKSAEDELWYLYDQFRSWVQRWNHINEWESLFIDAATTQLFEVLSHFKPDLAAFRSWAFTVARCAVLKEVRDLSINHPDVSLDTVMGESLTDFLGPEHAFVVNRVREEAYRLRGLRGDAVRGHFYEDKTDDEIAAEHGTTRRIIGYRRRQGLDEMAEHLRDVSRTSDCPKVGFPGYYYMMTDVKENEPAQLGREEGDCS